MISRIHNVYIAITVIALGAFFGMLLLRSHHTSVPPQAAIVVGDKTLSVIVADTDAAREQGLSNTDTLSKGTGMLFLFDTPGKYGFWMKDMHYPLDIIWIDSAWKVVGVSSNLSPDSYPTVFYAPSDVQYVLEINANEAKVDNFIVGSQLQFHQ